ncbi:MAG: alkane 1-monooxygenase [Chitinophagales bacterium]
MKDLKYFVSYLVPISAFLAIYFGGYWSPLTFIIAFVLLPFFELFAKGTTYNFPKEIEQRKRKEKFFDYLVYLNVPLQWGIIVFFLYRVAYTPLSNLEFAGMILSVGICCGVLGINVAHELGHRRKKSEQWMAKILLLSSLYMHFFIEHNRGHHRNVSTDLDPASSKKNEPIYTFYFRSIIGSYLHAWKLENERLRKLGNSIFSLRNEMIRYHIWEGGLVAGIFLFLGVKAGVAFLAVALGGYLLLESVNYIEHYGLRRKELSPGRYEKTMPWHSWNSNHTLGRIFLYDLTRHSDHHYLASRKYQVLRHMDDAPQLPTGYPGAILLALIPPLWFKIMNKRVESLDEIGKARLTEEGEMALAS